MNGAAASYVASNRGNYAASHFTSCRNRPQLIHCLFRLQLLNFPATMFQPADAPFSITHMNGALQIVGVVDLEVREGPAWSYPG